MDKQIVAETNRLVLRRYRQSDLMDLYEYLSDAKVVAFEPYEPMTLEQVQENLKWRISTEEMIAVELKATGKMIGNIYLGKRDYNALELGYVFHTDYWGKGYATEACSKLIHLAFAAGVHRISAECDPDNIHSWKLLERLGLQREGHLKQNVWFRRDESGNPVWKDTYLYGKVNSFCDEG